MSEEQVEEMVRAWPRMSGVLICWLYQIAEEDREGSGMIDCKALAKIISGNSGAGDK